MTTTYWLPEWWDEPTMALLARRASPPKPHTAIAPQSAMAQPATAQDITFRGGGNNGGGPPPAAAAAVQLTDGELAEIKRRKRQAREKRLHR